MRTALTFVTAAAIAVVFWFLRGSSDSTVLAAKDAQISAMQETVQAKADLLTAQTAALSALQEKLKPIQDQLAKAQAQVEFDKAELQRVKNADATIIASLKGDNNADIQALKEKLQDKEEEIAQINEKLVQTIADYEAKLKALGYQGPETKVADDPKPYIQDENGPKIYPKDNGFEAQSLGIGMFAYQIFGDIWNPNGVPQPPQIPNKTPWTFGGGNSGITANSAFCMGDAKNGNNDGTTSQAGQAAYLQTNRSWFSQIIDLPAGTFSVSFDYEARPGYGTANQIVVSLNGTDLFKGLPVDGTGFVHVVSDKITLAKPGKYELKFRGLGAPEAPGGDHTTFIDNVCLNVLNGHAPVGKGPANAGPILNPKLDADPDKNAIYPKDSGFDEQDLGTGFFAYQNFGEFHNPNHVPEPTPVPNQTPWKFGPSAGIAANGSGFYVSNATNGDSDGKKSTGGQAGFLTLDGSSISQSIHLKAGTYVVVFGLEARRDYNPNHISVSLGDKTLFEGVASDTNNFQQIITAPVTFTKSGDYKLNFSGHGGTGKLDGDAFIDDVRIRPVDPITANATTLQIQEALSVIRQ